MGESLTLPTRLAALQGVQVARVAAGCGAAHVLALDVAGTVYAWGRNDLGQLGLGFQNEGRTTPSLVQGLPAGERVIAVSARPEPPARLARSVGEGLRPLSLTSLTIGDDPRPPDRRGQEALGGRHRGRPELPVGLQRQRAAGHGQLRRQEEPRRLQDLPRRGQGRGQGRGGGLRRRVLALAVRRGRLLRGDARARRAGARRRSQVHRAGRAGGLPAAAGPAARRGPLEDLEDLLRLDAQPRRDRGGPLLLVGVGELRQAGAQGAEGRIPATPDRGLQGPLRPPARRPHRLRRQLELRDCVPAPADVLGQDDAQLRSHDVPEVARRAERLDDPARRLRLRHRRGLRGGELRELGPGAPPGGEGRPRRARRAPKTDARRSSATGPRARRRPPSRR